MMQKLKILAAGILITLGVTTALAGPVGAVQVFDACDGPNANTKVCAATGTASAQTIAQRILSLLFWIIGIASVIVIVIGGMKYVASNGDSNRIQSAKNTIMYAVIGLVVAIMGQAIVLFVANWMQGNQT